MPVPGGGEGERHRAGQPDARIAEDAPAPAGDERRDNRGTEKDGRELQQAGDGQRGGAGDQPERRIPRRANSTKPSSASAETNIIGVSGMTIRPKKTAAGEMAIRNAAARATDARPSRTSASR